jgi:hypothetical protein
MQVQLRKGDQCLSVQPPRRAYDQLRLPQHAFTAKHFVEGTCLESIRSCHIASNNTSGVRGVYKSERSGKWYAQITFQGKTRYLGCFPTLEEAAEARKKGEALFDEFLARYDMDHAEQKNRKIPSEEIRAQTRHIVKELHKKPDFAKISV